MSGKPAQQNRNKHSGRGNCSLGGRGEYIEGVTKKKGDEDQKGWKKTRTL